MRKNLITNCTSQVKGLTQQIETVFVERYHSDNCCTKRSVTNSRWRHYNGMIIAYPIRKPFFVNASRCSKFGKAFFEDLQTQNVLYSVSSIFLFITWCCGLYLHVCFKLANNLNWNWYLYIVMTIKFKINTFYYRINREWQTFSRWILHLFTKDLN